MRVNGLLTCSQRPSTGLHLDESSPYNPHSSSLRSILISSYLRLLHPRSHPSGFFTKILHDVGVHVLGFSLLWILRLWSSGFVCLSRGRYIATATRYIICLKWGYFTALSTNCTSNDMVIDE
jgi:hypothetical protein